MTKRFPHLDGDTGYPYVEDVNPFKYKEEFDYSKYDTTQMKITVCSVPWDVGLIHVGNAQIGGLGNVVKFESKEARDDWFSSLEDVYSWETRYRAYHTDGFIEVPLPYEKCVLYNYVFVEYTTLPVDYADGGKERFHFFIRSCEALSPSNCKVTILRDTWQDYIYDIDISYMMLERGHAPISVTSASRYLQNPIENCQYLLADDVNYGSSYVSKRASEIVLNSGEVWACIVTSANLEADWGSYEDDTANTPDGRHIQDGQPSLYCYSIVPSDLSAFLDVVPVQFFQTLKGVFFVKRSLVNLDRLIRFKGYAIGVLEQKTSTLDLVELDTSLFGYGENYRELAKLYTYPYAYLEISDENGNVNQVRIEETVGDISLTVTTSLAYPWLSLDGRLSGIGSGSGEVSFSNIDSHVFDFSGEWYNHLRRWNIPTFAVNVSASDVYEYESYYDREQRSNRAEIELRIAKRTNATNKTNADASDNLANANSVRSINTSYNNATASNVTAKTNTDASALTTKTNANNTALTTKSDSDDVALTSKTNANNSADTTYNNANDTALTARSDTYDSADTSYSNATNTASTVKTNQDANIKRIYDNVGTEQYMRTRIKALNNGLIINETAEDNKKIVSDSLDDINTSMAITGAENEATSVSGIANGVSGAVGNTAMGAVSGAAAGSIVPGVGTVAGAVAGGIGGLAGGIADAAHIGFTSVVSITTNETIAQATRTQTMNKRNTAVTINENIRDLRTTFNDNSNAITQQHTSEIAINSRDVDYAANSASYTTSVNVATATRNTDKANALRDYNNEVTCNSRSKTTDDTNALNSYNTSIGISTRDKNTADTNANNTYTVTTENATRSKNTDDANALRTKNTSTTNADNLLEVELANNLRSKTTADANADDRYLIATTDITTDIKQAGLRAPYQFGDYSNGDTSTTKPMGLFCNVVTQTKDAIEQAGDYFLRFGYAVNRAWEFTTFNLMPRFTYWKCSDIWVRGNNVPDAYMDEIRFFLLGGVCVWNKPEDIGITSIWDNKE